jgi:hypothetical protein
MRLLHLVLSPPLDVAAFRAWAAAVDIETLDGGSARLLATLYPRLVAAGIEHAWLPIMRGWYRRALYRNRLLVHRGLAIVDALQARGIASLLLKGTPLAAGYYGDFGARPMADFDLLIPEEAAPTEIAAILAAAGKATLRHRSLHADTYVDADGFEYDLHRHLQPELAYPGSSRTLWQRALPIELEGRSFHTLSAEDHVFHAMIHGMRVSDTSPLRWVVDVATILHRVPGFDWDYLVDGTRRRSAVTPVAAALRFLIEAGFVHKAAADALRTLAPAVEPPLERLLYRGLMRPPGLAYSCLRPWLLYRRLNRLSDQDKGARGFAGFLAELWDLPSASQVPAAALGKLAARIGLRPAEL